MDAATMNGGPEKGKEASEWQQISWIRGKNQGRSVARSTTRWTPKKIIHKVGLEKDESVVDPVVIRGDNFKMVKSINTFHILETLEGIEDLDVLPV